MSKVIKRMLYRLQFLVYSPEASGVFLASAIVAIVLAGLYAYVCYIDSLYWKPAIGHFTISQIAPSQVVGEVALCRLDQDFKGINQ